ncbi:MAG: DUF3303 domain-containing protein [Methanomassiliicoccales archaeon]|nr:DUF3303 domain-containing protein [Methanomassiliicoccales archaeon]
MLFIAFWHLGDIAPDKVAKLAADLMQKDKFPPEGVEVVSWLICPGGKGITILEAKDAKAAFKSWMSWVQAMPGFFKCYELLPAIEAQEAIQMALKK